MCEGPGAGWSLRGRITGEGEEALWLEPHSMAARAAQITCFELMYCDLFAPCQLQADCPVCYFPVHCFEHSAAVWVDEWPPEASRRSDPHSLHVPLRCSPGPGGRSGYSARTDRMRPGSLPDGRPALLAPSSIVCVPSVRNQTPAKLAPTVCSKPRRTSPRRPTVHR